MEPIQPPDWLRDTLKASDPRWQDQPPAKREPERAAYRVHPCARCGQVTSRIGWCPACVTTQLALDLHHLREEVRNGLRSDWPVLPDSHSRYQIDHTQRKPTIAAQTFFAATIARAEANGFIFDGVRTGVREEPLFWYYPDDEEYEAA